MDPPTGNTPVPSASEASESSLPLRADHEQEVFEVFEVPSRPSGGTIWTQSMIDLKAGAVHDHPDHDHDAGGGGGGGFKLAEEEVPSGIPEWGRGHGSDSTLPSVSVPAHFRPVAVQEPQGGQPLVLRASATKSQEFRGSLSSTTNPASTTTSFDASVVPPPLPKGSRTRSKGSKGSKGGGSSDEADIRVGASVGEQEGQLRLSTNSAHGIEVPMPRCQQRQHRTSKGLRDSGSNHDSPQRRGQQLLDSKRNSAVGAFQHDAPAPFATPPPQLPPNSNNNNNPGGDYLVEASLVNSSFVSRESDGEDHPEPPQDPAPTATATASVVSITDPEAMYNRCFYRTSFLLGVFVLVVVVAMAVLVTQMNGNGGGGNNDDNNSNKVEANSPKTDNLSNTVVVVVSEELEPTSSPPLPITYQPTTSVPQASANPTAGAAIISTTAPSTSPSSSESAGPPPDVVLRPPTAPTRPPKGYFNIHLHNKCSSDVQVAIYYQDATTGNWTAQCWYPLKPGDAYYATNLPPLTERDLTKNFLRTNNLNWYFYARAPAIGKSWAGTTTQDGDNNADPYASISQECGGDIFRFKRQNITQDGDLYTRFLCPEMCRMCDEDGYAGNTEKEVVFRKGMSADSGYYDATCGEMQRTVAQYRQQNCDAYNQEGGFLHWRAKFLRSACECTDESPPACPLCNGGKLQRNELEVLVPPNNNTGTTGTTANCWDKYVEFMSKPESECNPAEVKYYSEVCGCDNDS